MDGLKEEFVRRAEETGTETVPKPEPKVNGTKLRAAAMKYKGVVAKAYEEAKEEVDHYWTVKQTRKQYK